VVVASFLLLAGSVADRMGRRRTFQAGLVLFSLGSLLCSLAPSTPALVVFRMVQALGGAMLNPVAMAIIANTFLDPRERARAIGVWGAVFGVSMALGPVVGGVLTQAIGWRSIFWINVPIGVAAVFLTARFVPESRAARARRFDLVGQGLLIVGLASLTSAVIDGRRLGWGSGEIVGLFVVAAASVVAFLVYESRHPEPLIDLRFFRSIPFASATMMAVITFSALSGFLFLNSLYLQEARGLTASSAGLCTLPIAAALVIFSPLAGRLVGAGRARLSLVSAGCAMTAGSLLLVELRVDTPLPWLLGAYAIFGIGLGLVNAPITNSAVAGMPRAMAGIAAGCASTSRQIGASLGVAVAGTVAAGGIAAAHDPGFSAATHPVWWLSVGEGVAIAVLGFLSTSARARESAVRIAFLLDPPHVGAGGAAAAADGSGPSLAAPALEPTAVLE
jgi:EmrB/QacA subfamily drug resistance transporter